MTVRFDDLKNKFESNKNIIRVSKNKENPYVMVNKTCINDANLSWAAKGLHTYLMSLPDDWTIYINELVKHTSAGRDHTYSVVKELLKFGYMEKVQYRFKGKILGGTYTVFETPIDVSCHDNTKPRIVNVSIGDNGEIVENSTIEPFTENPDTVKADTVSTSLLSNNNTKDLSKVSNDDDDDECEKKLMDLYKSFKLEKRIMPHTTELVKSNKHISLEVFNQLFINATSKNNVYRYLQEVIKDLNNNQVITLSDFQKHVESRRKSNTSSKSSRKKTTAHEIHQTYDKYGNELEDLLKDNQDGKFEKIENGDNSNTDSRKRFYDKAVTSNWENLLPGTLKMAIDYAKDYNLPYKS